MIRASFAAVPHSFSSLEVLPKLSPFARGLQEQRIASVLLRKE
jgi:hypothetical protein